jgi:precorrin-3B synthase
LNASLTLTTERGLDPASRPSACPGLMRIVAARDGGLCRIRLNGGEISAAQARVVANVAMTCGSGFIDATNRANLQIRGVRPGAEDALISRLIEAGLGPATPDTDDLRNLMLSPLAGLDPHAILDVTPIARALLAQMQRDMRLRELSPKFACLLDGGERLAMLDHSHDVWFSAMSADRFAFGLGGCPPVLKEHLPAVASVAAQHIPALMNALLHTFLDLARPEQTRMRDLLQTYPVEVVLDHVQQKLDFPLTQDAVHWRRPSADAQLRFGVHPQRNEVAVCIGAQIPLGRLHATTLQALADLAPRMRMTPWQSTLLLDVQVADAEATIERLNTLGLATTPDEPFARLIACTGSQGCAKSFSNTKADAHQLAPLMPATGNVHLSGCARSCAAAHHVDTTLLAVAPGRYDLYTRASEPVARDITIEEAARWLARSTTNA